MEIDIEKVANVARIKLNDQEKKRFEKDLKSILEAFEIISKVNTENINPSYLPIEVKNKMRKDIPEKSKGRELLKLTNLTEEDYFVGPRTK